MKDFLFLMYDAEGSNSEADSDWGRYIDGLVDAGRFCGGSAIGGGLSVTKSGGASGIAAELSGYIRVTASSIEEARDLLEGNPTYEGGGRIEIRELPRSG